ncbi:MAG: NADH-quinone oxidoreductase subunit H [Verrucomicrobia bacterium]|nr:NADH-quinone oxidoreductase subunit H [Verrucomicrobiota bacterium]
MDFLNDIPWLLILSSVAKTLFLIFGVVLPLVSYTVYAERRVSALIQDRLGPNRTGFPTSLLGFKSDLQLFLGGLGQPIADAVKFLLKEEFTPDHVNKLYFWMAPVLAMVPALSTLAVLPFGNYMFGQKMVVADVNVGILYVFAIASVGVYGIVLAGWSSNSKYPFLGGIRSTSQMISYELSLGLSSVPVLMIIGDLNLSEAVRYQVDNGWLLVPFTDGKLTLREVLLWFPVFVSFVVFTISMFAETNRLPFDLPESETELVAGYHTEYSSMKFALFFLGEYAAMIAGSSLIVVLFLGGWHLPFLPVNTPDSSLTLAGGLLGLIHITVFFAKVVVLLLCFIWVRWTLPRFRFDQLMKLGWLYLFEIALVNIFVTAAVIAFVK